MKLSWAEKLSRRNSFSQKLSRKISVSRRRGIIFIFVPIIVHSQSMNDKTSTCHETKWTQFTTATTRLQAPLAVNLAFSSKQIIMISFHYKRVSYWWSSVHVLQYSSIQLSSVRYCRLERSKAVARLPFKLAQWELASSLLTWNFSTMFQKIKNE